mgnify:CR=1 FL=1
MLFKQFGDKNLPAVILLHGGGLSWWSYKEIIERLEKNYLVIAPIIDGHGEDGGETFVSIENSAEKLVSYIDNNFNGKIYALCGLSVGAQIAVEVLSLRRDISEYAVIESALVFPIKGISAFTKLLYNLFYGLIKQKWFAKTQSKSLCVPESMFDMYYKDSLKISKQSLINIAVSNANYALKNTIADTKAKALIIAGQKEMRIIKKSAEKLNGIILESKLFIAPDMKHGELSLKHTDKYINLLEKLFSN